MGKVFKALEKAEKEREQTTLATEVKLWEEMRQTLAIPANTTARDMPYFNLDPIATEQFLKLKTRLLRMQGDEQPVRSIMVTSAHEQEGKTLVAINLAVTIALELNAHALLVDCDFRRPSLASLFGLQNEKGLVDYLMKNESLPDLIVKTPIDKLMLLPSGQIPVNPVELIGSRRMADLALELKSRYEDRYIIFDSSPLLITTEPGVLERMVDGIILVIKAGETPRETVQQAMRYLQNSKMLGVVLNGLEFKSGSLRSRYFGADTYGYYGYRGYGYRSRDKKEPESKWRRLWPFPRHKRKKKREED